MNSSAPPPLAAAAAAADVPPHLRELAESLPVTLSPDDAARVLQITARTVRKMIAIGELRASRATRSGSSPYVIPRSELIRYLAERNA